MGVTRQSTPDEIKKAYRKLSKQFHPDVNPEGADRFKDIAEAYDTLSDVNKKKVYDNPNPFGGGGNIDDFFNMFNQQSNRNSRSRSRVPDKTISVDITPIESFNGHEKEINYSVNHACGLCVGTGGDKNMCNSCNGHGSLRQQVGNGIFTQVVETQCPTCMGEGYVIINPCVKCNGNKTIPSITNIKVKMPVGVDSGDFLKVRGKGDYYNNGYGNLVIKVNMIKKDGYEKLGKDLIYTHNMDALEFLIGDKITVEHPNTKLSIPLPKEINTEKPLRVKSKGYHIQNHVGDFYIKLKVSRFEISEEEKESLKVIQDKLTNQTI
mgnify:FL=1